MLHPPAMRADVAESTSSTTYSDQVPLAELNASERPAKRGLRAMASVPDAGKASAARRRCVFVGTIRARWHGHLRRARLVVGRVVEGQRSIVVTVTSWFGSPTSESRTAPGWTSRRAPPPSRRRRRGRPWVSWLNGHRHLRDRHHPSPRRRWSRDTGWPGGHRLRWSPGSRSRSCSRTSSGRRRPRVRAVRARSRGQHQAQQKRQQRVADDGRAARLRRLIARHPPFRCPTHPIRV